MFIDRIGFVFQFGELVKFPTDNVKLPGSNPANVILKSGERDKKWRKGGSGAEIRLGPEFINRFPS